MELENRAPALCLWCFDLLFIDGVRIAPMPLTQRKDMLNELVNDADEYRLQFSGEFSNPERLLVKGPSSKASFPSGEIPLTGQGKRGIG